jgi:hypothetical protein
MKSIGDKYVALESMIEFAKDGIVSKTLVKTSGREVSLFCMSAGQTLSTHKSSFPCNNTRDTGARRHSLGQQDLSCETQRLVLHARPTAAFNRCNRQHRLFANAFRENE